MCTESAGRGAPEKRAMSSRNSRIPGHNCWTSIVGGATTIGFGGSVGQCSSLKSVTFSTKLKSIPEFCFARTGLRIKGITKNRLIT